MWPAEQNTHVRLAAGPVFRSVLTSSLTTNCVAVLPATGATNSKVCPADVSHFLLQNIYGQTAPLIVEVRVILRLGHPRSVSQSVLVFSPSRPSWPDMCRDCSWGGFWEEFNWSHVGYVTVLTLWRLSQSSFLSNFFPASVEHCFLEGSYASPVCPSGKSDTWMKINTEHWWNVTDRRKPKYSDRNLSQCQSGHYKSNTNWHGIDPRHLKTKFFCIISKHPIRTVH